ncbi:MAG: hypothetical protein ABEI52_05925, partial [Halobacteriaceae archaeon]
MDMEAGYGDHHPLVYAACLVFPILGFLIAGIYGTILGFGTVVIGYFIPVLGFVLGNVFLMWVLPNPTHYELITIESILGLFLLGDIIQRNGYGIAGVMILVSVG